MNNSHNIQILSAIVENVFLCLVEDDVNFLNSSNYAVIFWSDDGGTNWELGGGITDAAAKDNFAPIFANEAMVRYNPV